MSLTTTEDKCEPLFNCKQTDYSIYRIERYVVVRVEKKATRHTNDTARNAIDPHKMQRTNDVSACMNSYGSNRFSFLCSIVCLFIYLFCFRWKCICIIKKSTLVVLSACFPLSSESRAKRVSLSLSLSLA